MAFITRVEGVLVILGGPILTPSLHGRPSSPLFTLGRRTHAPLISHFVPNTTHPPAGKITSELVGSLYK